MMRKLSVAAAVVFLAVQMASAESMRTMFTKDYMVPETGQIEAGADFQFTEYPFVDQYIETPYVRYGLCKDLTVYGKLPILQQDAEFGGAEDGLGDVAVGLELLAYKDIFDYPWIMPYVEVSFPTGDEDEGRGTGETTLNLGLSAGSTVQKVYHLVLDARWVANDGQQDFSEDDNHYVLAASGIWDLNQTFSLVAEVKGENLAVGDQDFPVYYVGGMSYKPTENLRINFSAGASGNSDVTTIIGGKVAYTF
jgi:hypothetical protein